MQQIIKDIINQFGGRYFGSPEEKKAQQFVQQEMDKFCDKTQFIEFKSALEAHFQSFKLFIIVYVLLHFLIKISPIGAVILGLANSIFFLGHFVTYRHWLDFLFQKKSSWNVIGDIEPIEKATSTIIFAGHIDSVKEFKWWYKLKKTGIVLSVLSGILIVLQGLFTVVAFAFPDALATNILWWAFIIATPALWVCFDMHGKDTVQGANDNLTGVAMSVAIGKHFSTNRPKNTRIRIISFGAEESGLRGAWDYAKTHKQQLIEENAILVNLDTIKDEEHLTIASSEVNTLCFFRKDLIAQMKSSFDTENVPVKILPLTVGASDASAFHIQGLPVISMIGMMSDDLDPTYHTRLDNLDHLCPKAMEKLKPVLVHFAEEHDKKNG